MSNTSYPFQENKNNVMHAQGGEKKVMKKILSVALSTAMAFSMFASVAFGDTATLSTQEKFDALKVKGIFAGDTDGLAHLERDMTRAEFAKVITKVMGLKEVTGVYSYNDTGYNNPKNWAAPYIEAVSAAGVMQGKDLTKKLFDQKANVTVQELAEVLVKALKLEIPTKIDNTATEWAKGSVQAAINAGLISKDLNFQANANRSLLVEAAFAAEAKLNVPPVTTATKVEKVSATNLKQITVTFDGTVDPTSAEQVAKYTVIRDVTGATSIDIDQADVAADNKSVVLTLKNGNLINNTAYKLSVSGIKTTGTTTVTTKDVQFTAVDAAAPTVDKVEALGNTAFKVTFSEPVNISNTSAASNYFVLDGKVVSGTVNVTGNTVIVKSFTKLADGEHKLITKNSIVDYAGYPVLEKTFDFTVTEDKVAPTLASVGNVTFESATVTFSEDVDSSTVSGSNVYWLDGSVKRYASSGFDKQVDGKTFRFVFTGSSKLPSYATDLYVTGAKDYSGNQIAADSKLTVNAVVDQARPEIASFSYNNTSKSLTFKFTKVVASSSFAESNLVIKNSDGKVVANRYTVGYGSDQKTLVVTLANALDAGTYTYELVGIKDQTLLANTMLPYSDKIVVSETAQPTLLSTVQTTSSFILNFNKKMAVDGEGSILNPSNYYATYTVDSNPSVTGQLPTGTTYETLADQKSVLIKLPQGVRVSALSVQGVKSAAGNVLTGYTANALASGIVVTNFQAVSAKAVAKNEVLVKMNQPVASVVRTDYVVKVATIENVPTDAWVDAADNTIVHLKLADNTLSTSTTGVTVEVVGSASQSVAGLHTNVTSPVASTPVRDAIAPTINKNSDGKIVIASSGSSAGVVVTGNIITLNFSENIRAVDPALAAQYLTITKSNGDVLVAGNTGDYNTNVSGSTLTITLRPTGSNVAGYNGVLNIALNNSASYITDATNGVDFDGSTTLKNVLADFNLANDAVNPQLLVVNNPTIAAQEAQQAADEAQSAVTAYEALPLSTNAEIAAAKADAGTVATNKIAAAVTAGVAVATTNALTADVNAKKADVATAATVASATVANGNILASASSNATLAVVLKNAAGVTLTTATGPVTYAWTVTAAADATAPMVTPAATTQLALTNATTATVSIAKATAVDVGDNYTLQVVATQGALTPVTGTGTLTAN